MDPKSAPVRDETVDLTVDLDKDPGRARSRYAPLVTRQESPKNTRGTFTFTVQASYKTKAPKQRAVIHTTTRTLSLTVM